MRTSYHVETQSALTLCLEHKKVHDAHYRASTFTPWPLENVHTCYHISVDGQSLLICGVYTRVFVDDLSILVHNPKGGDGRGLGGLQEVEGAGELAIEGTREQDSATVSALQVESSHLASYFSALAVEATLRHCHSAALGDALTPLTEFWTVRRRCSLSLREVYRKDMVAGISWCLWSAGAPVFDNPGQEQGKLGTAFVGLAALQPRARPQSRLTLNVPGP